MSNLTFQLNPGLRVSIQSFAFEYTYEGILEGNMQEINQHILEKRVPQRAAVLFFQSVQIGPWPIYVRRPEVVSVDGRVGRFPDYICFALLHGPTVQGRPDSDAEYVMGSRVGYCWFTNEVDSRLSDLISAGLETFDWDKIAENWGI